MNVILENVSYSDKPSLANQDSDEIKESKPKPQVSTKKKIIRKKNKSKTKHLQAPEHSSLAEVSSPTTMAPFGIFQSETQKCQRLQHYLRKDIENFYKTSIESQDYQLLESLVNSNLIQLSDVYHKNLNEIWRQKNCSLSQIRSYLEIVNLIRSNNGEYCIVVEGLSKKCYLSMRNANNGFDLHQINQFESRLLQKRDEFLRVLRSSEERFKTKLDCQSSNNQNQLPLSQLSTQIAFLFKFLYDSTKSLKSYVSDIKNSIQELTSIPIIEPPTVSEGQYISFLLKKLVLNSLRDVEIDYLNFFKNNQSIEHNYGPPQATLSDQKQFEEFMRKKKNKKGKKGKYVLHSACLGCCSSHYQQYNPFSYCQECYVRFHRSCYAGFAVRDEITYINSRQQKDVVCEACFNKRNNNIKHRGSQCDFCGLKGLLSVPAGQFKRIHIFCMLLNGLWTVNNGKLEFKSKTENKVPMSDSLRCMFCNSGSGYLHFCNLCEKYVHASCAFFGGWKINAQFDDKSENVQLIMQCCNGVAIAENEKRRKFVTNYKKQAYSF